MNRRDFVGLGLMAICAPAIVRASSLMPIKAWVEPRLAPPMVRIIARNHNGTTISNEVQELVPYVGEPYSGWEVAPVVYEYPTLPPLPAAGVLRGIVLKTPNGPRPPPPAKTFLPWESLPGAVRLEGLEIIGQPAMSDYLKVKALYDWAARIGAAPFQAPHTYREWSDLAGFKWNPMKTRQSNKMTEMNLEILRRLRG